VFPGRPFNVSSLAVNRHSQPVALYHVFLVIFDFYRCVVNSEVALTLQGKVQPADVPASRSTQSAVSRSASGSSDGTKGGSVEEAFRFLQ
jgi:hypothetical protein